MNESLSVPGPTVASGPFFFLNRISGRLVVIILLALFLVSCATPSFFLSGGEKAERVAKEAGWRRQWLRTADFTIAAYHNGLRGSSKILTVYLEGDGRPWIRLDRISSDPTPPAPIVLSMAVRDPSPKVLYLARPCQYRGGIKEPGCNPIYWTSNRYGEKVIASMNQALDQAKALAGVERLFLIGYSGGGSLAVLLAARRDDVAGILTVAANLDHAAWTAYYGDSPLSGSLNAVDAVAKVRSIPQVHLWGDADDVVPLRVIENYTDRLVGSGKSRLKVIPGFGHECCWAEEWPKILNEAKSLFGDSLPEGL